MEKNKVLIGVLTAGLAVSLVGNVYLWNSLNQKDTEYIAAMANLEEELTQNKEAQDTLRQQLEQTKADLQQVESQPKGEIPKEEEGGNPLEGMTEEDLMKELLDTSGAPTKGDLDKLAEDAKEKEQGGGQSQGKGQSQGQGGQSQGQTGGQGQSGTTGKTPSGLTPEQQAELERILAELPGGPGVSIGDRTPGGNIGDSYTGPGINWNK